MGQLALFEGLVVDPAGQSVQVAVVGGQANYVVEDGGFKFHVDAEGVDRQVLRQMGEQIQDHRDVISAGTMKMLGQDDLFTKAAIDASLNSMDASFEQLLSQGLPEGARAYLGMLGFSIVLNYHGDVLEVHNPGLAASDEPE
jgi:hypothetical protein